ncbi:MAG: lipooligosaccharide transport system ATP-binding protein [Gaiellaceae bacterium]|nr:lipooligosaccharide transport system ATP-binding protein [Gaiellaceae bacterium]
MNNNATTELAIRLRGVVKRYGEITAVGGLDVDVPYGTCVGLLGPNGAGKTTTMRMLTAQAIADEGELEVLGFRLPEESKQARAQLGVTPQLDNLDVTLTVEQNLLVFAHLYRIGRGDRRDAIERVRRARAPCRLRLRGLDRPVAPRVARRLRPAMWRLAIRAMTRKLVD